MPEIEAPEVYAEVNRVLRERRTVHEFIADPVADEILNAALETMRWAPNHHRTEPWRVYLLGPHAQRAIAEMNAAMVLAARGERAAEVKLARWAEMPGWLVITSPLGADGLREQEDYAACCCAAHNLMLSLWAAGVGVKWTTGAVVRESAFAECVGFDPRAEQVVGLFWYGWPARVGEQQRRELGHFVTRVG